MEEIQEPSAEPRAWAWLGWLALGVLGAAATLMALEIALPGELPYWVGYAMAAVCFGFVYVCIFRAWRAKRAKRCQSMD